MIMICYTILYNLSSINLVYYINTHRLSVGISECCYTYHSKLVIILLSTSRGFSFLYFLVPFEPFLSEANAISVILFNNVVLQSSLS